MTWAADEAHRLEVDAPRHHVQALLGLLERLERGELEASELRELDPEFWLVPDALANHLALEKFAAKGTPLPARVAEAIALERRVPNLRDALSDYLEGAQTHAALLDAIRTRATATTRPAALLTIVCLAAREPSPALAIEAAELFAADNEAPHVLLLLLLIVVIASDAFDVALVERVFELWGYYGVFDILIPTTVQQICVIALARETPLVDLATRLDAGARKADPAMHQLAPYHLLLSLAQSGPDAALEIFRDLVDEDRLVFGEHGVGRRAVLEVAATRPEQVHDLLHGQAEFAAIHAALALDLDLAEPIPPSLQPEAERILAELRAHRDDEQPG